MSVAWAQDGDGKYLVESAQHLLQIMNKGSLGIDTGSVPTDYWAAHYLQTQDIDLASDHASILPIGSNSNKFTGAYDGGLFQIKNWSYAGFEGFAGLFGYTDGATLRKLRLSGVWENTGFNLYCGFLCGQLENSMAYDVEGDFAVGSAFGDRSTDSRGGTLFGWCYESDVQGATVRGSVNFATNTRGTHRGGIAGQVNGGSHTLWRNLASFPNGIGGGYAGGFVGEGVHFSFSKSQNSMVGDITGTHTGGIVGYVDKSSSGGSFIQSTVNSMTGNITSTTGGAGGIFGETTSFVDEVFGAVTITNVFNYMRGDITGASGAGGMIGAIVGSGTFVFSIAKSIVAMQGVVDQSVRGSETVTPQIDVTVDTSFGMTYTGNDYGSATMVVDAALLYDPGFTDLPYIDTSGTDADGTAYDCDFVYGNIGGKYPEYTHLTVHTAEVSAPYYTDFGLADTNDVVYLTYANIDTNTLYHNASLTVVATAAANFLTLPSEKDDFLFGNVYDITEAGADVAAAVNDLFATGDAVAVNVNHQTTTTTFVNRGDQIDVAGVNAVLLPFDPDVADVQDATLTLSDSTSVDIGFDQPSGQISVDGTMYSAGDYFIMDGKKVTVVDK